MNSVKPDSCIIIRPKEQVMFAARCQNSLELNPAAAITYALGSGRQEGQYPKNWFSSFG